jgi:hypothetical protein
MKKDLRHSLKITVIEIKGKFYFSLRLWYMAPVLSLATTPPAKQAAHSIIERSDQLSVATN